MRDVVIFDFDGTLADTIDLVLHLYNARAPQFGTLPIAEGELQSLRKMGYKKAMKAKGVRLTRLPRMVMVITKEMRQHMGEVKPYEGVVDMLATLRKHNKIIGVLTSNQQQVVQDFLHVHNFPPFDFVVSEKTLFGKDKALKKIIRSRGFDKNHVVYVGDEPRDVSACRRIGIPVIGVSWGLAGRAGFKDQPPDAIIDSPDELLEAVNSLE